MIDGGKGIRKAIDDVLGDLAVAVVQRCQIHKRRNLKDHLPKTVQAYVDRVLREAYGSRSVDTARKRLRSLLSWLESNGHEDAAGSLREGMEETLTVLKLELPPSLRRSMATTNAIENMLDARPGRISEDRGDDAFDSHVLLHAAEARPQESFDEALPPRVVCSQKQLLSHLRPARTQHAVDSLLPIRERVDAASRQERRPRRAETHAERVNAAAGLEQQVARELAGHEDPRLQLPGERSGSSFDLPAPGITDVDDPFDAAIRQYALDARWRAFAFQRPEGSEVAIQRRCRPARGVLQAPYPKPNRSCAVGGVWRP